MHKSVEGIRSKQWRPACFDGYSKWSVGPAARAGSAGWRRQQCNSLPHILALAMAIRWTYEQVAGSGVPDKLWGAWPLQKPSVPGVLTNNLLAHGVQPQDGALGCVGSVHNENALRVVV